MSPVLNSWNEPFLDFVSDLNYEAKNAKERVVNIYEKGVASLQVQIGRVQAAIRMVIQQTKPIIARKTIGSFDAMHQEATHGKVDISSEIEPGYGYIQISRLPWVDSWMHANP